MADLKKSSLKDLLGQGIKEIAEGSKGALGNAADDIIRRSNDVSRGAIGDEYKVRATQNAGDNDRVRPRKVWKD